MFSISFYASEIENRNGIERLPCETLTIEVEKEEKVMEDKQPFEYDRYSAANLSPDLLNRVMLLETEIREATDKDVVLIAYEESQHNPT